MNLQPFPGAPAAPPTTVGSTPYGVNLRLIVETVAL